MDETIFFLSVVFFKFLRQWSYIRLWFLENVITDANLPELTPELIKEMIPQIGLRMEFLKKWTTEFKTEKMSHVNAHIIYIHCVPRRETIFILVFLEKTNNFFAFTTYGKSPLKISSLYLNFLSITLAGGGVLFSILISSNLAVTGVL